MKKYVKICQVNSPLFYKIMAPSPWKNAAPFSL